MNTEELVKVEAQPLALRHELSVEEVLARIRLVHRVMDEAMVEGHHYGKIPGTDKPTLLKPGAELLDVMFRLDPQYHVETIRDHHLTVTSTCTLYHIPTGQRWGSGMGSCSTRESKYAYRKGKRTCPKCGSEQINKSRFPPRHAPKGTEPGWYCYAKAGGCGHEFAYDDPAITEQQTGRVVNEDLADIENTVLKMANKRSLVAAVLNVTAASDIFTQDLEDLPEPVVVNGGRADTQQTMAEGASSQPARDSVQLGEQRGASTETADEHAQRLFPTPEEQEAGEKAVLLGRIGAGFDKLKMPAPERIAKWAKHAGGQAPFMTAEASLDALTLLLDELHALHASAQSRAKK